MELHGSMEANLASAIRSARRLRGHPVHADTLGHWTDLLHQARRDLASETDPPAEVIEQLLAELETELAERTR
jgi:hypothetical protein